MKILKKELIGAEVKILKSKNKANEGIKGEIIDETMNTITIKTQKGKKKMAKDQNVFGIKTGGRTVEIDGRLLTKRPEERVKSE